MKITLDNNTLMIDGESIVDARPGITKDHPRSWVDKKAFMRMGDFWREVKRAYLCDENVEQALKALVVKEFGIVFDESTEVEITGGIPKHWKEEKEGKIELRRKY